MIIHNNKLGNQILSLLMALVMVISMMPMSSFTAFAADGAATTETRTIMLGTSHITGGQASNIYFGNYQQASLGSTQPTTGTEGVDWIKSSTATKNGQGPYYSKSPIKWRVLSNDGSKLLLLSDKNLDVVRYHEDYESVTWETSTIRSWLNGYAAASNQNGVDYASDNFIDAAFGAAEKGVIADTTVVNDDNPDYNIEGGNNTTDKVFFLSIAEARNTSYFADNNSRIAVNTAYVYGGGKIRSSSMAGVGEAHFWRLRSPGNYTEDAAGVFYIGTVDSDGYAVTSTYTAVRPAFNLNLSSVLFTSAADGGKLTGIGLTATAAYTGNEYKLTLLDSSRNFSVSDTAAKTVKTGDTFSLEYTGAMTGTNEYISAMIVDANGAVVYYGQLAQAASASGNVSITIPLDIAAGDYTLKLFNEQINGDYKTDFSSAFVDISLTVHNYNNGMCTCGTYEPAALTNGVYQIANAGNLFWFAQKVNNGENTISAVLTANIDMITLPWEAMGQQDAPYTGTFDGRGYTISNLSRDTGLDEGTRASFVYYLGEGGCIKNVTFDSADVFTQGHANANASAVVALRNSGTIECVVVTNSRVQLGNYAYLAGIAGVNESNGVIKNCAVLNTTLTRRFSGGSLAGGGIVYSNLGTVEGCYTYGCSYSTANESNGGILVEGNTPVNSYYYTTSTVAATDYAKTTEHFASGEVTYLLNGGVTDGSQVWYQTRGQGLPAFLGDTVYQNTCGGNIFYATTDIDYESHDLGDDFRCSVCGNYDAPEQDANDVYQIVTPSNLFWFAEEVNKGNTNINAVLTNDIDLNSVQWMPIGNEANPFMGTFDGQNYKIENLYIHATEGGNYGVFGYLVDGTVKNFSVSGNAVIELSVQEAVNYGVIGAAAARNAHTYVTNVHSTVTMEIKDSFDKNSIAGIVGYAEGKNTMTYYRLTIDGCSFGGSLSFGSAYVDAGGGIAGYVNYNGAVTIQNCLYNGTITSEYEGAQAVGGIMGYNRGNNMYIKNCLSIGTLKLKNTGYAGAVAGRYLILNKYIVTYNNKNNYYTGSLPAFSNTTDESIANYDKDIVDYAEYKDSVAASVTDTQLTSGQIAYALGVAWGQELTTDSYPIPGGPAVYTFVNCNNEAGYANRQKETGEHSYVSGICSGCGLTNKVHSWSMTLNDHIAVNFLLKLDSADAVVKLTVGDTVTEYTAADMTLSEGLYKLCVELAAAQMTQEITFEVLEGEETVFTKTYTVRQYCDTILADEAHSEYHTLVKEMLNYGAMAQVYFDYNTENLANDGITGAATNDVPETAEELTVSDKISGLYFYGASLVYRDQIAVRYYFTGDVTGCTFSANGNTYTPVAKDGVYYVEIADILPQELDQQITLIVTDADGNALSVAYGPMNYIVRMNAKGNDNLKNLLKALYNYHLAAKELVAAAA